MAQYALHALEENASTHDRYCCSSRQTKLEKKQNEINTCSLLDNSLVSCLPFALFAFADILCNLDSFSTWLDVGLCLGLNAWFGTEGNSGFDDDLDVGFYVGFDVGFDVGLNDLLISCYQHKRK